jgi:hypothetical protein
MHSLSHERCPSLSVTPWWEIMTTELLSMLHLKQVCAFSCFLDHLLRRVEVAAFRHKIFLEINFAMLESVVPSALYLNRNLI